MTFEYEMTTSVFYRTLFRVEWLFPKREYSLRIFSVCATG